MKLAICLLLVMGAGCSKDKTAATTLPAKSPPAPAAATDSKPVEQTATTVPVSQSVTVSGDLAQACGLQEQRTLDPHFAYDRDELTKQDRDVLSQIATCLTTGPLAGRSVGLVGRADPRGTEEYNLGLGSRRAQSVSDFLGRLGVKSSQLSPTTRGALDARGSDEAGWREDRRVDLELQKS